MNFRHLKEKNMDLESRERAENKVLLLYFTDLIKIPVSNMQLTRIMLENRFMNYFLLQQSLHELIQDKLVMVETREDIDYYTISEEGLRILEMFLNILPVGIKKRLDESIDDIRPVIRQEASVISEYTLENEDEYEVRCKIIENFSPLSISVYRWAPGGCPQYLQELEGLCQGNLPSGYRRAVGR
jgi:predicted transcriptional regulator